MQTVPLQATPSQIIAATLGGQPCQINVYQKTIYQGGFVQEQDESDDILTDETGSSLNTMAPPYLFSELNFLFVDLYVNNVLLIGGVQCRNAVRIVRDAYFGFIGDLAFYDTQGNDDPVADGLGTRWQLVYLASADLTAASV